jgi:hypothetical protein
VGGKRKEIPWPEKKMKVWEGKVKKIPWPGKKMKVWEGKEKNPLA